MYIFAVPCTAPSKVIVLFLYNLDVSLRNKIVLLPLLTYTVLSVNVGFKPHHRTLQLQQIDAHLSFTFPSMK